MVVSIRLPSRQTAVCVISLTKKVVIAMAITLVRVPYNNRNFILYSLTLKVFISVKTCYTAVGRCKHIHVVIVENVFERTRLLANFYDLFATHLSAALRFVCKHVHLRFHYPENIFVLHCSQQI